MCGIGSKDSQIFVTDMDTIEKSNLNRQFLFKNSDIGQVKSDTAAREIMKMNPTVNVISHQNKVCADSESVYDSKFFDSIDIIKYLESNPDLLKINSKITRNEGLLKSLNKEK